jgi:hypothetical protein
MRIPNEVHRSHAWRILQIVPDFTLEDVWALPVHGGAGDFQRLLEQTVSADPGKALAPAARALWHARDRLGSWLGLDRTSAPAGATRAKDRLPIPGTNELSLANRLPNDLRGTAKDLTFHSLPFVPLYRTDVEFAAEISNKTVHGVMHLAWVDRGAGRFEGQMAVYVKPRGRFGKAYMAFIKPFRYLIVYPALMRQIERAWNEPAPRRKAS